MTLRSLRPPELVEGGLDDADDVLGTVEIADLEPHHL